MRKILIFCLAFTFIITASVPVLGEEIKKSLTTVSSTTNEAVRLEADKILVTGIDVQIVARFREKGLAYRTIALICGIADKSGKTPEEVAELFLKLKGIDKVAAELRVSTDDMKQIRNNLEILKKNANEQVNTVVIDTKKNAGNDAVKKITYPEKDTKIKSNVEVGRKTDIEKAYIEKVKEFRETQAAKEKEELKNQLRETVIRQLRQELAEKVKQQLKDELRERVRQELRAELRESILRELKIEINNNRTESKTTEVQKAQLVENPVPQVNKTEEKGKGISLVDTLVSVSGKSREEVVEVLKTERELGRISKRLNMTDEQYKLLMQKLTSGK